MTIEEANWELDKTGNIPKPSLKSKVQEKYRAAVENLTKMYEVMPTGNVDNRFLRENPSWDVCIQKDSASIQVQIILDL